MMDRNRVSVIVCAYTMDRWDDIREAIDSLRQQTRLPDEIIVVIDHNEALFVSLSQTLGSLATVVQNGYARGLSGARNTGIGCATGSLVAFLDDDAVAGRHWIEHLIEACEPPDVLGATAWVAPRWLGPCPEWFPDEFLWTVGCSYRGMRTKTGRIRNLLGGAMMIKRSVFDRIGGFNSVPGRSGSSLASCEETEMCLRASAAFPDGRFLLVPEAFVSHKVPTSRLTWSYLRRRCYAEGRSKAHLGQLVQTRGALGTERDYVLRTLSSGVLVGLRDSAVGVNLRGVKRAAAILLGLGATVFGYATVRLRPLVRPAERPTPTLAATTE